MAIVLSTAIAKATTSYLIGLLVNRVGSPLGCYLMISKPPNQTSSSSHTLLTTDMHPNRTQRQRHHVHIVEVTYTSDTWIHKKAHGVKSDQHTPLKRNLRSFGWGNVTVHTVVLGSTGAVRTDDYDTLQTLGVGKKRRSSASPRPTHDVAAELLTTSRSSTTAATAPPVNTPVTLTNVAPPPTAGAVGPSLSSAHGPWGGDTASHTWAGAPQPNHT